MAANFSQFDVLSSYSYEKRNPKIFLMGYLENAYFYDIIGQFSTNFHHAIDYFTASGTLPRKKLQY